MVRSGREPPVFMAGGRTGTLAGWSGDGKMLGKRRKDRREGAAAGEARGPTSHGPLSSLPHPSASLRGTYLIPGTSQDRGREEDEDS